MPVNAGMMRESIYIGDFSLSTADATGAQADTFTNRHDTTRAEVRKLSGSESYRAKQVHADATYQVRIRYDDTVLTTCRFTWGSLYLYPVSITHDNLKREMIILCRQTS